MFPDMPSQVRHDLEPLVFGNMDHIVEVRKTERALDIEHREWMICVGRGFDFLHMPNLALIIGPYSPDLADPIPRRPASSTPTCAPAAFPTMVSCCWPRCPTRKLAWTAPAPN